MGMDDMKMEKKSSTDGKSRRGSSKKKQQIESDDEEDAFGYKYTSEELEKKRNLQRQKKVEDFKDGGGFPALLKAIFTPTDQASIQLDSVF